MMNSLVEHSCNIASSSKESESSHQNDFSDSKKFQNISAHFGNFGSVPHPQQTYDGPRETLEHNEMTFNHLTNGTSLENQSTTKKVQNLKETLDMKDMRCQLDGLESFQGHNSLPSNH